MRKPKITAKNYRQMLIDGENETRESIDTCIYVHCHVLGKSFIETSKDVESYMNTFKDLIHSMFLLGFITEETFRVYCDHVLEMTMYYDDKLINEYYGN